MMSPLSIILSIFKIFSLPMFYRKLLLSALTIMLPFQIFANSEGLDLLKQIHENRRTRYLSGWLQADAAWYNSAPAGLMDNGADLRRGVLNLQATIYDKFGYKIQYDFANAGTSGLKDAYIVYSKSEALNFILGNTKDPFMLQDQISRKIRVRSFFLLQNQRPDPFCGFHADATEEAKESGEVL